MREEGSKPVLGSIELLDWDLQRKRRWRRRGRKLEGTSGAAQGDGGNAGEGYECEEGGLAG